MVIRYKDKGSFDTEFLNSEETYDILFNELPLLEEEEFLYNKNKKEVQENY